MIKFEPIKLGRKDLNDKALAMKNRYFTALNDFNCPNCNNQTIISFNTDGKSVNIEINYCCEVYQELVTRRLSLFR